MMPFLFREPVPGDAKMILDWRTSPGIVDKMTSSVPYDIARQEKWLADCAARPDYIHFVVLLERDSSPVGYLSYGGIDWTERSCTPGFYLLLAPADRHLAGYFAYFSSDYAFHALGMNKIVFPILGDNERILASQRRRNLHPVRIETGTMLRDGKAVDTHWFEQPRQDYVSRRRIFPIGRILAAFPPLSWKYVPPQLPEGRTVNR